MRAIKHVSPYSSEVLYIKRLARRYVRVKSYEAKEQRRGELADYLQTLEISRLRYWARVRSLGGINDRRIRTESVKIINQEARKVLARRAVGCRLREGTSEIIQVPGMDVMLIGPADHLSSGAGSVTLSGKECHSLCVPTKHLPSSAPVESSPVR